MAPTTVLLVEDNPGDARLIREALASDEVRSFRLVHLERLGESCARLGRESYDAILLDLSLPDSHGLDTVRQVRKAAGFTPIVVLTGLADESVAVEAIGEGAQDYLVKGDRDFYAVPRAIQYAIERQRLQTRLRNAHRLEAVGQLAAGIAHQFNSLMAGVLGHAELLRDGQGNAAVRAQSVDEIIGAATRAVELTDLLLSVGRQRRLRADRIDLNEALRQMAPMLRNIAGPGISIALALGTVSPIVFDAAQLEHVVATLTMFARDAMPAGGQIRFESGEAERDGATFVRLTVADSGAALDPETLARQFEPFHDLRRLADERRSGLELPAVMGILAQAGGSIESPSGEAAGRQFVLHFPTAVRSTAQAGVQ